MDQTIKRKAYTHIVNVELGKTSDRRWFASIVIENKDGIHLLLKKEMNFQVRLWWQLIPQTRCGVRTRKSLHDTVSELVVKTQCLLAALLAQPCKQDPRKLMDFVSHSWLEANGDDITCFLRCMKKSSEWEKIQVNEQLRSWSEQVVMCFFCHEMSKQRCAWLPVWYVHLPATG